MTKLRWKKNGPGYIAFTVHGMYVDHEGQVSYSSAAKLPTPLFTKIPGGRAGAQEHHEKAIKK